MIERGKTFSMERPVPKSVIHHCIDRIENSPLIFIAALNGTAMGGGLNWHWAATFAWHKMATTNWDCPS